MQRILCTIFERAPSLPGRLFLPASVVAVLLWGALAPAGLAAQEPPGAPPPAAPRSAPPAARPTGPSGLDLYVFVKKLNRINARPETAFRPAQAEKLYDLLEPLYERPELEPREIRTLLADARRALTPAQTAALDAIQDITPQSVMPPAPAAAPGQGPFGPGGPPGGFPGGPGGFPGGRRGGRRGGPPVDPSADPGFNPFYTMSRGGLTDQAGRDLRAVLDALERAAPPVTTHPALVALSPSQKINVTTHHYDLARTGWNAKERILTPRTVEKSRFGRWWHMPLDGQVYASPLVVTSMSIAGRTRDIIIAPTENNSVYALDADTGTVLWKQHLARALTDDEYNDCINITPLHGITSTPFIDLDRKEIYVCGLTQAKLKQVYKAWALDLTTGAVKPGWPITLQGRYKGTAFDGGQNTQRGALTMVDGWIYIPFASRCDIGEWRGWVLGVDTHNPSASQRVFSPSPDAAGSGIWGAAGLAVDRAGNLFAVTGNGTFTLQDGGYSLTDAIVRLTTTDDLSFSYQPKDFFVPSNYEDLDRRDQDLGGSSAILIDHPGSATPHLVFTGGKDGLIYLVDRDNLGGVGGEIQKQRLFGSENGGYGGSIKTTPAYFEDGQGGQYVFVTGNDQGPGGTQGVVALKLGLDAKKRSQLKPVWSAGRPLFQPGAAVVSSNGNADAIVWVIESNKPDDETGPPGVLHAYDARTGKEIYRSTQREQRDSLGDARKFSAPTVANGRVYCGTDGVVAYGPIEETRNAK